jgi:uncharacterized protein YndB with AHSA1/START domain
MTRLTESRTANRIEKKLLLRAPKGRVWRALTDSEEFGGWFRVRFEGPFAVGKHLRGTITHPGYEHLTMDVLVERIDPDRGIFSFRWHPYAVDPKVDYSNEPTTLVEFRVEEVGEGTLLTVVESGFDRIPAERRLEAFRMNSDGWESQLTNVQRHVEG